MDLITINELQSYMQGMGSPLSNVDVSWVQNRISAWSLALAQYCGRLDWGTNSSTVTEYFSGGVRDLQLHQVPNVSITDVCEDSDWGYGTATARSSDDYTVDADFGVLMLGVNGTWLHGPRAVRVRYTGGYTGVTYVPVDLKEACLMQCAHAWRHLRTRGAAEAALPNVGAVIEPVRQMLAPYKLVAV